MDVLVDDILYVVFMLLPQLTGLPQTGSALGTSSKASAKEPVAADTDADLQARLDPLNKIVQENNLSILFYKLNNCFLFLGWRTYVESEE